jgi:acyl-CoA reductase-like NAD-dependent aldehyde dehydrogenase
MEIINPATGDLIGSIQPDNAESLQLKLKELQLGQVKWHQVPVSERIAVINRYAELLEANIEELALTLTSEVGKPLSQ